MGIGGYGIAAFVKGLTDGVDLKQRWADEKAQRDQDAEDRQWKREDRDQEAIDRDRRRKREDAAEARANQELQWRQQDQDYQQWDRSRVKRDDARAEGDKKALADIYAETQAEADAADAAPPPAPADDGYRPSARLGLAVDQGRPSALVLPGSALDAAARGGPAPAPAAAPAAVATPASGGFLSALNPVSAAHADEMPPFSLVADAALPPPAPAQSAPRPAAPPAAPAAPAASDPMAQAIAMSSQPTDRPSYSVMPPEPEPAAETPDPAPAPAALPSAAPAESPVAAPGGAPVAAGNAPATAGPLRSRAGAAAGVILPSDAPGQPVATPAIKLAAAPDIQRSVSQEPPSDDERAQSFMDRYRREAIPKVVKHYLAEGEVDKAKAFEAWAKDEGRKAGMEAWAKGVHAAAAGDEQGFLNNMIAAYNADGYFDDGLSIVRKGSGLIKDAAGNITGAHLTFRDRSGKTWSQSYDDQDIYRMGINWLAPESVFEYGMGQIKAVDDQRVKDAESARKQAEDQDPQAMIAAEVKRMSGDDPSFSSLPPAEQAARAAASVDAQIQAADQLKQRVAQRRTMAPVQ